MLNRQVICLSKIVMDGQKSLLKAPRQADSSLFSDVRKLLCGV